jgi:hypothetical protein
MEATPLTGFDAHGVFSLHEDLQSHVSAGDFYINTYGHSSNPLVVPAPIWGYVNNVCSRSPGGLPALGIEVRVGNVLTNLGCRPDEQGTNVVCATNALC